jgi:uncharacterized membrane protein
MTGGTPFDPAWWITAIEIPVLTGMFWMVWRIKRDAEAATEDLRRLVDRTHLQLREALAAYKLEVAKSYASIAYMKDVERRLTDHLLRIEGKLDRRETAEAGR